MDITELLTFSAKQGASDLHLSAGLPPMIRVDGDVRRINVPELDHKAVHGLIYDIMNDKQRRDFEEKLETDFSFEVPGVSRFRVNAFNQNRGAAEVFRTIPTEILSMETLGMGQVFKDLASKPRGLVLVTGPTGSGKSTTLASMIQQRNQFGSGHIVTVEDPIEYLHKHGNCIITQREVGVDTDSFEAAPENTLRQAPDCIVIGEIRSKEAMQQAITFAETGHLCLATLHANTANQALERILHFFPKEEHDRVRMDLAMNLKGILGQQLLPTPTRDQLVLATEILFNSPLVADKIRNGELHKIRSLMARSATIGMQTFDQALFTLYQRGLIRYEEALKHANSINDLRLQIKLAQGIKRSGHSRLETQGFAE